MALEFEVIANGSVTTPLGFLAGAVYAGIKTYGEDKLDLGLLVSERPASAAGTFTTNTIVSGSVRVCQRHISRGIARAVVVNSGCANCCVGEQGVKDALETTALVGRKLAIPPEEVLICSTGIIGVELPMGLIREAIPKISLSREGGHAFARAILTTDSRPKEVAIGLTLGGKRVHIGGCVKGAGMIHPQMATMLAFLTTDATIDPPLLRTLLKEAVDASFNMVDVDNDQSTNDTVLLLANGAAGAPPLRPHSPEAETFQQALTQVCTTLAKDMVRYAEGATKLIEATVEEASTLQDARLAARAIVSSNLVKTAVYGGDPNWGRVMMAIGKSGAQVDESKVALYINGICVMEGGVPIPYFKEALAASMKAPEVRFRVRLGLGNAQATAWGSDLSEAYVTLNSAYTT
ncbi:MAG: bifunctional glutamate N-acetyltransferase/amino-acid acetyltransferase ArgJ [Dehalococcoidia bacterium]|nr:bifunctional glutamate N-acetyltransferase/amino-acid acetyltransferase ArgJ [Dehalococcoidia bacterium]MDW8119391.1 bifunctional glutamate N-acetyltransferase/amino-acid acetyltransferase ArgJ [Chloroflexota bacterium]